MLFFSAVQSEHARVDVVSPRGEALLRVGAAQQVPAAGATVCVLLEAGQRCAELHACDVLCAVLANVSAAWDSLNVQWDTEAAENICPWEVEEADAAPPPLVSLSDAPAAAHAYAGTPAPADSSTPAPAAAPAAAAPPSTSTIPPAPAVGAEAALEAARPAAPIEAISAEDSAV